MKTILSVLILAAMAAGCHNPGSKIAETTAKQDLIKAPFADSGFISVVAPKIPDRTITVGGADADLKGFTSEAIQTAIDALRLKGGGGTVRLMPGVYDITAPVRLYDNMALTGSGPQTILKKCKGVSSSFSVDADYGELEITVPDASGFRAGMGVAVYDDDQRSGWALTTARISAVKGNKIFLNDYLLRDYRSDRNGRISNACSVIEAVSAENIRITDLTVDGSKGTNDMIDGCRAGGIYLHKVQKAIVENVTVRDFNSDGISWQITEYVEVRNCEVYGCTNSGLHPGTGSPFTLIENNNSHDNGNFGLFVCWRVRNGIVRGNSFHDNGMNGLSTGHKDTNILFADNHIFNNGEDGITLRGETPGNEPDGTVLRNNIIENNCLVKEGYAIAVFCAAKNVLVEKNTIRNTGRAKQIAAVYIAENGIPVILKENTITGFPKGEQVNVMKK